MTFDFFFFFEKGVKGFSNIHCSNAQELLYQVNVISPILQMRLRVLSPVTGEQEVSELPIDRLWGPQFYSQKCHKNKKSITYCSVEGKIQNGGWYLGHRLTS